MAGDVPEKYTRILPYIPGAKILELGSAEGVLSLLLASKKEQVFALEKKESRHRKSLELQSCWHKKNPAVNRCKMICGDIKDHLDLIAKVDTLVAVRSIYYLGGDIHYIFENIAKHVNNVVLCGNAKRAAQFKKLEGPAKNYYATAQGMKALLEENGYYITTMVTDDDPIVVGTKTRT